MSGGSLNYAYGKLDDAIIEISRRAKTPLHKAFVKHLVIVSKALHDIEWVFSSDYAPEDADEAIRAVLGEGAKAAQMGVVADELRELIAKARELLKEKP